MYKVLSYNLSWKTMSSMNAKNIKMDELGNHCSKSKHKKCIQNVGNTINKLGKDCDFIALQEVLLTNKKKNINEQNIKDIKIYPILNKKIIDMNFHISISGKEYCVTLYNSKFELLYNINEHMINTYNGKTVYGRPFHCLFLYNPDENEYIIFINLHAGHGTNANATKINKDIQRKIKKHIKDNNIILPFSFTKDDYKIIMAGDFNNNIEDKDIKLLKYEMRNSKIRPYTCCNYSKYKENQSNWTKTANIANKKDNEINLKNKKIKKYELYKSDIVLYNKYKPKYISYKTGFPIFPSSDHLPVLVHLKI